MSESISNNTMFDNNPEKEKLIKKHEKSKFELAEEKEDPLKIKAQQKFRNLSAINVKSSSMRNEKPDVDDYYKFCVE